jgi:hypothetical protein
MNKLLSAAGKLICAPCADVGETTLVIEAVSSSEARTENLLWMRIGGTLKD